MLNWLEFGDKHKLPLTIRYNVVTFWDDVAYWAFSQVKLNVLDDLKIYYPGGVVKLQEKLKCYFLNSFLFSNHCQNSKKIKKIEKISHYLEYEWQWNWEYQQALIDAVNSKSIENVEYLWSKVENNSKYNIVLKHAIACEYLQLIDKCFEHNIEFNPEYDSYYLLVRKPNRPENSHNINYLDYAMPTQNVEVLKKVLGYFDKYFTEKNLYELLINELKDNNWQKCDYLWSIAQNKNYVQKWCFNNFKDINQVPSLNNYQLYPSFNEDISIENRIKWIKFLDNKGCYDNNKILLNLDKIIHNTGESSDWLKSFLKTVKIHSDNSILYFMDSLIKTKNEKSWILIEQYLPLKNMSEAYNVLVNLRVKKLLFSEFAQTIINSFDIPTMNYLIENTEGEQM